MKALPPYKRFNQLVGILRKVPGVGERGALRMALHFAALSPSDGRKLAKLLLDVVDNLKRCEECGNLSFEDRCWVCLDGGRDRGIIMLVESVMDLLLMEDAGFKGLYHVVGGLVPEAKRISPSQRKQSLERLVKRIEATGVREVVIAFPFTLKGESLTKFFAEALKEKVLVTRLSRGIPVGGEIEFMDTLTLNASFERRHPV